MHGLNDYAIDSKGDSGSKVREASLESLEFFLTLCAKNKDDIVKNQDYMVKALGGVIQQSVERIDRTRNIAGRTLAKLLHNEFLDLDYIPCIKIVKEVFTKNKCKEIDWNLAYVTLPLFMSLLKLKEFRTNLLTGVVYSIGSLTESLVKPAISTFLKELKVSN